MLIAIGYPANAIINPIMNIAKGINNASLKFIAPFKYSSFSEFKFNRDFAIKYRIMSTIIKSKPYNAWGMKELGLFATNIVK